MKLASQLLLATLVLVPTMTLSAAKKKSDKPVAPATSATTDSAMQAAMKMDQPNANHQMLATLAGKWNCTIRMWMDPNKPPQEEKGSAENTMVFNGRFLKQEYKGQFNGQPFEGAGYTGYNNLKSQFESVWMDNFASSMMITMGTYDATTKTITMAGSFSCPMTGEKDKWVRNEVKFVDNNTNIYTSYMKGPDGKEMKSMEITYTRVQ